MEHTTEYYIVAVTMKEVKSLSGKTLIEEDQPGFLAYESEFGYPSISSSRSDAMRFLAIPTFEAVCAWDGMPWYCRIKSHKIIHIEEVRTDLRITETPL